MPYRLIGLPVVALMVCSAAVLAEDPEGSTPTGDLRTGRMLHGSPDRGVAAYLLDDNDRFVAGESISLAYGLIAVERPEGEVVQEGIDVSRPMPAFDPHNGSWFSVTGPEGEELPYQGPYVSWAANRSDQNLSLWPGEFVGRTHEINLLFDFSRPGEYRLKWHHGWAGPGLVSNEIRIVIVETSGGD